MEVVRGHAVTKRYYGTSEFTVSVVWDNKFSEKYRWGKDFNGVFVYDLEPVTKDTV